MSVIDRINDYFDKEDKEQLREEKEIITLLTELDVKKTVRDVKRAGTRIADTQKCSKMSQGQKYGCMISVYKKYIGSLKGEMSRSGTSDDTKAKIKEKIAKAEERIKKWEAADKASKSHSMVSRLGGKSKSVGVKTSKQKKKETEKAAKKGTLGGWKI